MGHDFNTTHQSTGCKSDGGDSSAGRKPDGGDASVGCETGDDNSSATRKLDANNSSVGCAGSDDVRDADARQAHVQDAANAEKQRAGISRRALCLGVGGIAALLALGGVGAVAQGEAQVRPPGGQDENRLIGACIRCEKCYEVCPRDVIAPAHIEDGIVGVRTPVVDFSKNWCDFCEEENGGDPLCVKCCPTKALSLPADATAQGTIIGIAEIVTDWCLAYRLIGCKFCSDACPYDAIELDSDGRPQVIAELCNGCGACEAACVSMQNGAISAGADSRAITIRPLESALS